MKRILAFPFFFIIIMIHHSSQLLIKSALSSCIISLLSTQKSNFPSKKKNLEKQLHMHHRARFISVAKSFCDDEYTGIAIYPRRPCLSIFFSFRTINSSHKTLIQPLPAHSYFYLSLRSSSHPTDDSDVSSPACYFSRPTGVRSQTQTKKSST